MRTWLTLPDGQVSIVGSGAPQPTDTAATQLEKRVLKPWGGLIAQESARTGVPRSILAAFIWAESMGNPNARGGIGEAGLMQLSPGVLWRGHTEAEMMEPARNVAYGADFLAQIQKKYGLDLPKMASAYNCGTPFSRSDDVLYPWGLCEAVITGADGTKLPSHYIDKIVAMNNYVVTHHPDRVSGPTGLSSTSTSKAGAVVAVGALAILLWRGLR